MKWSGFWLACALLWAPDALTQEATPLALPSGATESFIDEPVFQARVRLVEAGAGRAPTVVVIHGIGDAGVRDWYRVLPTLAAHYHVLAFDLPGFAQSSKSNRSYTPLLYATFVKWLTASRVPGPFVLVGHSLGGAVALRYASLWPQDLQRLVIVDAAGILYRSALVKELNAAAVMNPDQSIWSRGAKLMAGKLIQRLGKMPVDLGMIWGAATARRILLGGESAKIAALALIDEQFGGLLGRVSTPTVILWGSADRIAPPRTGRLLAATLPDARLEVFDGVGHEPMHQNPELFQARLLEAVGGPLPPSAPRLVRTSSTRIGHCQEEKDMVFTGEYQRIEIVDCDRVRLVGVSTGSLSIDDSDVVLERVHIEGGDVGITMHDGELTATGLVVRAAVGLVVDDSQVDLAGADLQCSVAAVQAKDSSDLLISASRFRSPVSSGGVAGIFALRSGQQL